MGHVKGVPYKLVVVPIVSLVLIMYFFFSGPTLGPGYGKATAGDKRHNDGDHETAEQGGRAHTREARVVGHDHEDEEQEQGGGSVDRDQRALENLLKAGRQAGVVKEVDGAHHEVGIPVTEPKKTHDEVTNRPGCYYITGGGVGDVGTLGMYAGTDKVMNGHPVYHKARGAWSTVENWLGATADEHWIIALNEEQLRAENPTWRTLDSCHDPHGCKQWATFINTDWVAQPAFSATPKQESDCTAVPPLDSAVPIGGAINPVKGVAYEASYNVSDLAKPTPAYDYPKDPAFRYIEDREGETPPFVIMSYMPKIYYFEKLLTDAECDAIVEHARGHIERSGVAPTKGSNASAIQDVRTSSHAWLTESVPEVNSVINRLLAITGFGTQDHEALQVLRYSLNQKYDAHHDYFDPNLYGAQTSNRAITCFLYLDDVEEGGETAFPRANGGPHPQDFQDGACHTGLRVKPRKGSAALFYDMRPDYSLDEYSLHSGCPVKKGTKWGGTLWLRKLLPQPSEEVKQQVA